MSRVSTFFRLREHGTTIGTEVRGGVTTFLVMAYIIFVNARTVSSANPPLAAQGAPDAVAVAAATALAAGVLTLAMGLVTNYPFAVAAGMGLNAVVAFDLIVGKGMTWPEAMAVVVWEGLCITLLVVTGLRGAILDAIPLSLKRAIAVGIGLFMLMIGLFEGGVLVKSPASSVPLTLGLSSTSHATLATFAIGLVVALALVQRRVKGALLYAILAATGVAVLLGVTQVPARLVHPLAASNFAGIGVPLSALGAVWHSSAGPMAVALAVFTIMLSDFFDTAGTVVGLGERGGLLDAQGRLPRGNRVLFVDGVAAMIGGIFGTSSNTTYIESAAGLEDGARTGLASVVTGGLFLLAIVLAPLAGIVPAAATAPALVVIGYLMFSSITRVAWDDVTDGFPVLATLIMMPLAYSITDGIGAGFVSYGVLKLLAGRRREVPPLLWGAIAAFVVYFLAELRLLG